MICMIYLHDLYDLLPVHDLDLPGKADVFLICMMPGGNRKNGHNLAHIS